jgi:hypothetical protein
MTMSTAPRGLLRIAIKNFRGIVELEVEPQGRSFTVRGKNGSGKSSAVDALWWGLGGSLDGEVVRRGAPAAETEIAFDDYLIRRRQVAGKPPTLTVRSADGKVRFNSPTTLLAGFIGAIDRRTFTARPPKEQAEILRRLAPGLDCSDLDAARSEKYDERTIVNREEKALRARACAVEVWPASAPVLSYVGGEPRLVDPAGAELEVADVVDVAEIAARKGDVERQRAENNRSRTKLVEAIRVADGAKEALDDTGRQIAALEAELAERKERQVQQLLCVQRLRSELDERRAAVAALVDPDLASVDAEIAEARKKNAAAKEETRRHNAALREAKAKAAERERALQEHARLLGEADQRAAVSEALTREIERLDEERARRIAEASCPVAGLALAGDVVTYDDGQHGPVEARLGVLNDAACVRLDVEVAAALGYRLVAVRNAERLDPENRAALDQFAAERDIRLVCEVRTDDGDVVEAVIEAGPAVVAGPGSGKQREIDL